MTSYISYYKFNDKYLDLLEKFSNYLITYKLDQLDNFPKKASIVIFDDTDRTFSEYSTHLLKKLLKKKTKNIIEVRKTGIKDLPWKVSSPINLSA